MFKYRLHSPSGDDLGEATYAQMIDPGEEIIAGKNEHFRVVAVVQFEEGTSRRSWGYSGSRRRSSVTWKTPRR